MRQAVCPGCGTVSGRVHGGYRRRLADVAVSGHRTVIDLLVSRFICPARDCDRWTFSSRSTGSPSGSPGARLRCTGRWRRSRWSSGARRPGWRLRGRWARRTGKRRIRGRCPARKPQLRLLVVNGSDAV
ncbi:transposase family protein [Streptomyces qaidamensis]|uniref:transposase family protein n=1 Tax=Streptomyces qaidamensis TaxID=1783515 RepID=UPI003AAAAA12